MKNVFKFLLKILNNVVFKVIIGFILVLFIGYFVYTGCHL